MTNTIYYSTTLEDFISDELFAGYPNEFLTITDDFRTELIHHYILNDVSYARHNYTIKTFGL